MLILLTGGCKNGKSKRAEEIAFKLSEGKNLFYLATMIASDSEDEKRIKRHIENRAYMPFCTVEKGRDIIELIKNTGDQNSLIPAESTVLMDSLTALLSNEMFKTGDDGRFVFCDNAAAKVFDEICELYDSVSNLVIVSDYIQSEANIFDEYTEKYRESLAYLEKNITDIADKAIEIVAGKEMIINEKLNGSVAGMSYWNSGESNIKDEKNHLHMKTNLIIGGAYQGKESFAKKEFNVNSSEIYICDDLQSELPRGFKCYEHLEKYVYACTKEGVEPVDGFDEGTILIMDDIFCGVVPMDEIVRAYRENAGRYLQRLSSHSEVFRVFCGKGIRL